MRLFRKRSRPAAAAGCGTEPPAKKIMLLPIEKKRSRPAAAAGCGTEPPAKKKKITVPGIRQADVIYRYEREEKKRRKEKMLKVLEKIRRRRGRGKLKLKAIEKTKAEKKKKEKSRIAEYDWAFIPPVGFTLAEYKVCLPYMSWRTFETKLIIPEEHKALKVFYDQVRKTRGYGVTAPHPNPFVGRHFNPLEVEEGMCWESTFKSYMPDMMEDLVDAMQRELKLKLKPEEMQLINAVEVTECYTYLLSLSFKPQTMIKPSEGGSVEVEVDTVEAMFYVERFFSGDHFLREWKLKSGSQLVYSTSSTEEGMEYFTELMERRRNMHLLRRN